MSFLLFLVPFIGAAIAAAMLIEDYLNSFGNDQFTTMNLPEVQLQPAPKLKAMAKATGR
jgi:hypothetical protein